jgi:hypothetical protein
MRGLRRSTARTPGAVWRSSASPPTSSRSRSRAAAPGDFGPQYGGFYDAIAKIRPGADGTDEVKWNFTKFLIGRDGTVIKRYEPPVPPAEIKADLENYL